MLNERPTRNSTLSERPAQKDRQTAKNQTAQIRKESHQSHFHETEEVRRVRRSDAAGGGAADLQRPQRNETQAEDRSETKKTHTAIEGETKRLVKS